MPFLSEILRRQVVDSQGHSVGKVKDIVIGADMTIPQVTALVVSREREEPLWIALSQVKDLEAKPVSLAVAWGQVALYRPAEDELELARDVMDKQIIDTDGLRVVRVNDLLLARVNGGYRLIAVDISLPGMLRRLGLGFLTNLWTSPKAQPLIPWEDVELVPAETPTVRLRVPYQRLAKLHPADIGHIVSQLNTAEASLALGSMEDELAADALAEVADEEHQAAILSRMDAERAADILEEMQPDEAADVLAEFPAERRQELIARMEPQAAEEVQELLAYEEDTAGGLMTTHYIAIPPELSAQEAIERLRQLRPDPEAAYYIYVTDAEEHLLGVISIRELVVAPADTKVADFMQTEVISVVLATKAEEVARLFAKYDLLTLPVVDSENRLQGIVAVSDAMDVVTPRAWKSRSSRMAG